MTSALLSQRLNTATDSPHQQLDAKVKSYQPFDNLENFAHFAATQYLYQQDIDQLYQDAELATLIPNLAQRSRLEAARLDLQDLKRELPTNDNLTLNKQWCLPEALAWLFVSEGSKLGAAFLYKRVVPMGLSESFGARHLAEPEGGRAQNWKSFVSALDAIELTAEQVQQAEQAAVAAFQRFAALLEQTFA